MVAVDAEWPAYALAILHDGRMGLEILGELEQRRKRGHAPEEWMTGGQISREQDVDEIPTEPGGRAGEVDAVEPAHGGKELTRDIEHGGDAAERWRGLCEQSVDLGLEGRDCAQRSEQRGPLRVRYDHAGRGQELIERGRILRDADDGRQPLADLARYGVEQRVAHGSTVALISGNSVSAGPFTSKRTE